MQEDLSSHTWTPDSRPPNLPWQHPTIGLRNWSSVSFFWSKFFWKKRKKIIKNAISRKPKRFEQSYLDARFATPEFTLTAPHYRVEKLKFGLFFFISNFFEKKKIIKNAISRKPKGFEQSYLDSRFATSDCTPIAPHFRVKKFKLG